IVMTASRGGKIKTLLQAVAIGLLVPLFPLSALVPSVLYFILLVFACIVMAAANVVTVVTGIDDVVQAATPYRETKQDGGAGDDGPNADGPDRGAGPDGDATRA